MQGCMLAGARLAEVRGELEVSGADGAEHGHPVLLVEGGVPGNHLVDKHPHSPPAWEGKMAKEGQG